MLELEIPGFGFVQLEHVVTDFTGTLSVDGSLVPGVREQLHRVADFLKIHVLTADTFGKAREELKDIDCDFRLLHGENHDIQKEDYVNRLGAHRTVALGNGNNDRRMLKTARIGIAVCLEEGCSRDAVVSSDVVVTSTRAALDLLLHPNRLKATLRF